MPEYDFLVFLQLKARFDHSCEILSEIIYQSAIIQSSYFDWFKLLMGTDEIAVCYA